MSLGDFLFPDVQLKLAIVHSFEADIESVAHSTSESYVDSAAIVWLNKSDFQKIGLKDGDVVSVKTGSRSVNVQAYKREDARAGLAVMPRGPWSLSLVDIPNDYSPVQLHGLPVSVTRSSESVTSLESLSSGP
ncbi:MAG: molybdopterin dinucleotide binding domain-containing protein [Candidatus Thorarchaeota archaeon]|jgi:formylmethanofuran dehydrogenase subunit D